MQSQISGRDKVHNLSESINVLEYVIHLVEHKHYRFDDADAPQYIAELKKVVTAVSAVRDDIARELKT